MKHAPLAILTTLLLSACGDDGPTAADIEEGYRNLVTKNLALAVADFGSEDQIPPILLGMIQTTARIDGERCEKNQNDLGFICSYNLTPINGSNVVLDTIPDIKARVWQVDAGWMVHEIPEMNRAMRATDHTAPTYHPILAPPYGGRLRADRQR